MQYIKPDVATICTGMAASMGRYCCAGAAGKRSALPHSRVMIHQPSGRRKELLLIWKSTRNVETERRVVQNYLAPFWTQTKCTKTVSVITGWKQMKLKRIRNDWWGFKEDKIQSKSKVESQILELSTFDFMTLD
jgi:hypothetical protein